VLRKLLLFNYTNHLSPCIESFERSVVWTEREFGRRYSIEGLVNEALKQGVQFVAFRIEQGTHFICEQLRSARLRVIDIVLMLRL
jgi:hypothetical protein